MSSLAQALENPKQSESVTTISATARVDYILRFSKQAVMVIDEQISLCSSIGSQFLSNLSSDKNAAYITMSAKLNDLQVRCRIIEQLFGNTLFDPEQSVAVSLINLVKKHQQAISIVIDNAHLLSLQLTHELCQLVEIAKKSDYQISILMLSTPEGGLKISQNQSLFHKKLAIISAQSGQLISHNSKIFKQNRNHFAFTPLKKWLVFFLSLALISAAAMTVLLKRDTLGFSDKISHLKETQLVKADIGTISVATFVIDKSTSLNNSPENLAGANQASVNDIYLSLLEKAKTPIINVQILPQKATSGDIVNAIENFTKQESFTKQETIDETLVSNIPESVTQSISISNILSNEQIINANKMNEDKVVNTEILTESTATISDETSKEQVVTITPVLNYYQGLQPGFVIQIAGFSQQKVLSAFLADFQQITFNQYKRFVSNNEMTILTTEYFSTRKQAEQAFIRLPQTIKDRSPWIKSISTINDEINHFQRSQSAKNKVTIPTS